MRRPLLVIALVGALCLSGCQASPAQPAATPALRLPAKTTAYFIGDSWTAGYSAAPDRGFPQVASEMLGWTPVVNGNGGAGFLRVYIQGTKTLPAVAAAVPKGTKADVVVLEGGLNDQESDLGPFQAAVERTVRSLQTRFPGKPVVVLGPAATSLPLTEALGRIDRLEKAASRATGAVYISPIEQGWFTTGNIGSIMDPKTNHPSTAGHAYFGGRLALALKALESAPRSS